MGETEGFLDELANSSSSSMENRPWSSSSMVSLRPRLLLLMPLSSPPRRAPRESLEEVRGCSDGDFSEILVLWSSRVSIDMLACFGGLPISEPKSPPASEEERNEEGRRGEPMCPNPFSPSLRYDPDDQIELYLEGLPVWGLTLPTLLSEGIWLLEIARRPAERKEGLISSSIC